MLANPIAPFTWTQTMHCTAFAQPIRTHYHANTSCRKRAFTASSSAQADPSPKRVCSPADIITSSQYINTHPEDEPAGYLPAPIQYDYTYDLSRRTPQPYAIAPQYDPTPVWNPADIGPGALVPYGVDPSQIQDYLQHFHTSPTQPSDEDAGFTDSHAVQYRPRQSASVQVWVLEDGHEPTLLLPGSME